MAVDALAPHDRRHLIRPRAEEQTVSVQATVKERVLITAEGYEQHRRELDRLRDEERRRLSDLLRDARSDGTLDDNPALADLLDEQAQLERRIATLEAQLAAAELAPPPTDGRAAIGSLVHVRDIATGEVFEYQLVGPIEGDAMSGRVSIAAPIGRALVGRQRGALVDVATPRGPVTLEVLDVAASAPASRWRPPLRQMGSGADGRALSPPRVWS
jgi:transcription elongation factor GreA